jgi:hypothetical protein
MPIIPSSAKRQHQRACLDLERGTLELAVGWLPLVVELLFPVEPGFVADHADPQDPSGRLVDDIFILVGGTELEFSNHVPIVAAAYDNQVRFASAGPPQAETA